MKPWALLDWLHQHNPNSLLLSSESAFFLYLVKDWWKKKSSEYRWSTLNAAEVSVPWISDQGKNLALFIDPVGYVIEQAEKLSEESCKIWQENWAQDWQPDQLKKVLFLTEKKIKHWSFSEEQVTSIKIENPMPWEGKKIFTFFVKLMNLDHDQNNSWLKKFEFDDQDPDWVKLYQRLLLASQTQSEYYVKLQEDAIKKQDNRFYFADLLNEMKLKIFWQETHSYYVQSSKSDFLSLIQFLKSHLLKIYAYKNLVTDNSAPGAEQKLNKYELKIQQASLRWDRKNLNTLIKILSELEIEAKQASQRLDIMLKEKVLSSQGAVASPF